MREWTLTLLRELPLWKLESWWTPKLLESDFRGQKLMDWKVFYIMEKLLECRCLKWARITHLDISNTSYDEKKGYESNCQFGSRPLKVRNRPDSYAFKWRATYCWKMLNKGYNFALDLISIGGLHTKLWAPKIARIHFGTPTWESLDKMSFGCGPCGKAQSILQGGRLWLPPSPGNVEMLINILKN